MTYGVIFESGDDGGGVGAYVPDLPGIGVAARDLAEARSFIDEAVQMHVEGMIEDGEPLPEPSRIERDQATVRVDPELVALAQAANRRSNAKLPKP